jgi:hypothetical protein
MNIFRISITAINPRNRAQKTLPLEAVVDTSTELTWLPMDVLWEIGVTPRRLEMLAVSPEMMVERGVGFAILTANGRETPQEVVFAEPGERLRVGTKGLQGLGIEIVSAKHAFIDVATMAAFYMRRRF